ncbi:MAG: ABC transporter ATP-binding protein [Ruminococcaceae bacterium]|nr:ABC transporter ATP-binding protein [Oscillospiraceae bacterium]
MHLTIQSHVTGLIRKFNKECIKMIKVKNLIVKFKNFTVINDISLEIPKGTTLGLVGESGSGKTTLGRSILLLNNITSGQIFYKGTEITTKNIHRFRPHMQMVFQDPYSSIDPKMKIENVIAEPLIINKICKSKSDRTYQVHKLLNLTGLDTCHASRYISDFSGGQRQRIAIARALATSPDFIIWDEAVSALDVSVKAQIINLIMELQRELGLTYLFISHDMAVVRHVCTDIAVLYKGTIAEYGTCSQICFSPRNDYTKKLIASVMIPKHT